ncbi:hypothetical protein [Lentilactobacillus kosonis]|uniref:hypothetical protein n=1 Tax=Lentilactobacillus kosonis TaxID=2810561 RepID=UPI000F61F0D7|nr:hypothetical protein [Lentilactobacillus kosonis]
MPIFGDCSKGFFEYLPFDVKFSAVLNEVKPIIKNDVDEFQLLVKNLELDVYAEQTFLRSSGAQKNKHLT